MAATPQSSAMLGDADAKPSSFTLEESSSEQQLLFPMWVVPIREMLALAKSSIDSADGLPWHEVLQEQGTLRCWEAGMNSLFFSHTWLGWHHPDPNGDKCRLIVALLEGILAGRVKVSAAAMATIIFGEQGVAAEDLARDFDDGYVWMDFVNSSAQPDQPGARHPVAPALRRQLDALRRARRSVSTRTTARSATSARGASADGAGWRTWQTACRRSRRR